MKLVLQLLEIIAIVLLVRFVLQYVFSSRTRQVPPSERTAASASAPVEKFGEMKKDPQCGTYVSTELSVKIRRGGEVLHFCSPQCVEAFSKAQSSRPA
ncbi:MAG: YHS domain-containing protein [Acidobacteria bacterium]|nr:YHS domain-containing protein [Acidobacteriota bacterium]